MPTKLAHTAPIALPGTLAYPVVSPYVALDRVYVLVSYKTGPAGSSAVPGFTFDRSFSSATEFCDVWYRVMAGGESGNIGSVTATGMANPVASAIAWRGSATGLTLVGAVSGSDVSSDLSYSATTGSTTTAAGQALFYVTTLSATSTRSARTLTQAGATLGTLTAYFGAGTGITQEVGDRPVTTGATAAIVNTYTLGTAATGLTGVLVLADAAGSIVTGVAAFSTGLTAAATGKRTTFATAAASAGLTAAATGTRTRHGVAAASFGLTAAAIGVRKVFGTAAAAWSLSAAAVGRIRSTGIPGQVSGPAGLLPGSVAHESIDLPGTIR